MIEGEDTLVIYGPLEQQVPAARRSTAGGHHGRSPAPYFASRASPAWLRSIWAVLAL